jgi:hypothetical protein
MCQRAHLNLWSAFELTKHLMSGGPERERRWRRSQEANLHRNTVVLLYATHLELVIHYFIIFKFSSFLVCF